ncbi:MAG: D-alanyl-D-alanine carboxypeptidase [Bacilli bacterium]|nr:D-alanyl-D-alanine carboxypeptidase [Bacilli bacterium]
MKKIILIILCFSLIFNVKALELDISSKNAIMYNLSSNEILYEKNSEEKVQIASLTKLMTALIVLEKKPNLDEQVLITNEDLKGLAEENLVTAGFTQGSIVTYKDLLYGLILPSGADAAKAISRNIDGNFIDLMNQKATELQLKNTHFDNEIGIDSEENYSTVKDLSVIFKELLKKEEFVQIIKTYTYTTSDGKLTFKSTIKKNAAKYNIDIPYILGGKTGTTDGAGLCLATTGKNKDTEFMLITTGALYDKKRPHNIDDAKIIYDYFIQNYSNQKIVDKEVSFKTLKTKYTKENEYKLYPTKDIIKYLPNDYDISKIEYKYQGLNEIKSNTKGKIGKVKIYYDNELLDTQTLYLKNKLHFSLEKFIKENVKEITICILGLLTLSIFIIKSRVKQ